MKSYICYVHTPASLTPQMRVIAFDGDGETFIEQMREVLEEWPAFDLVDVYDSTDKLVLRMAHDGQPQFS